MFVIAMKVEVFRQRLRGLGEGCRLRCLDESGHDFKDVTCLGFSM